MALLNWLAWEHKLSSLLARIIRGHPCEVFNPVWLTWAAGPRQANWAVPLAFLWKKEKRNGGWISLQLGRTKLLFSTYSCWRQRRPKGKREQASSWMERLELDLSSVWKWNHMSGAEKITGFRLVRKTEITQSKVQIQTTERLKKRMIWDGTINRK